METHTEHSSLLRIFLQNHSPSPSVLKLNPARIGTGNSLSGSMDSGLLLGYSLSKRAFNAQRSLLFMARANCSFPCSSHKSIKNCSSARLGRPVGFPEVPLTNCPLSSLILFFTCYQAPSKTQKNSQRQITVVRAAFPSTLHIIGFTSNCCLTVRPASYCGIGW